MPHTSFNLRHILKRRLASRPILTEGQNDSRSGEESIDEERMGFHGHGYCTYWESVLQRLVVGSLVCLFESSCLVCLDNGQNAKSKSHFVSCFLLRNS